MIQNFLVRCRLEYANLVWNNHGSVYQKLRNRYLIF